MKFRNEYYFLSNMYPCKVGPFPSVENAFQAWKCANISDRSMFVNCNPFQAKKLGRRIKMRLDWNSIKINAMKECLKRKFSNPELKHKLQQIKGEIVEENDWNDTFWGKCNGIGENNLGKLLMEIRDSEV